MDSTQIRQSANTRRPPFSTQNAVLAMAGVNIIWGTAFPLTKPALETIPPFTFALLRFSLALIILLPLGRGQTFALLRGPDGRKIAMMGLLGFCVAQLAQTQALALSPASDIALISTASPLWITLLAWFWLGERIGRRALLGFGLALLGLILILWPHNASNISAHQRLLGDAIFVINSITWGCYNVMGKDMMARYPALPTTAAAGLVGAIGLLPFAAGEWLSGDTPQFTLIGTAAVAYTGILVTVVGFLVLFWAYRRVSAAQVAITMYLQPLVGVLVAWALLHETLSGTFIGGAALVFGGVWVVTRTRPPATD